MEGEVQERDQEQERGLPLQMDGEVVEEDGGDIPREAKRAYAPHEEGRREEAVGFADCVVRRHPSSALALRLQGEVHRVAGESSGDKDARVAHLCLSMVALTHAAKIAPRCPEIAADLASVLASLGSHTEAESGCTRALGVRDPTEPFLHSVSLPPHASSSTTEQKIDASQDNLQDILADVRSKKNESDVPPPAPGNVSVIEEVKGALAVVQRQGIENAVLLAKDIACRHAMSPLAHHLHGFLYMELAKKPLLDSSIDRARLLHHALGSIRRAVELAPNSIVIVHTFVELLLNLGMFAEACDVISRARGMSQYDDPMDHIIPPGTADGATREEREKYALSSLTMLDSELQDTIKWSMLNPEDQSSFLTVQVNTLTKHLKSGDKSTVSEAVGFVKKNKAWRFWFCPYCSDEIFMKAGSFMPHVCNEHLGKFTAHLELLVTPQLCDEAAENNDHLDVITLSQDSSHKDIFILDGDKIASVIVSASSTENKIFSWLFSERFKGQPRVPGETKEEKRKKGTEILCNLKEKLSSLQEVDERHAAIRGFVLELIKTSVFDYREVILPLVRSSQWEKLIKIKNEMSKRDEKAIDEYWTNEITSVVGIAAGKEINNGRNPEPHISKKAKQKAKKKMKKSSTDNQPLNDSSSNDQDHERQEVE